MILTLTKNMNMMTDHVGWSSYALNLLLSHGPFSRTALVLVHFQIYCIIPVHKKGDKQIVHNYRPIPLLPIFGKILEKLFNSIMDFLENILLNSSQSRFRPNNSSENQLLSIVYDIHSASDSYPSREVKRHIFRYI